MANSKIKRSESVLAQASECRLLREPSLKDEEARSATATAVSSQGVYISFFRRYVRLWRTRYISRSARNSIYAHFVRIRYVASGNDGRYATCRAPHAHNVTSLALPFWQRISSALALYRVLYISSATRYAKHIERRVSDAYRRSAEPSASPQPYHYRRGLGVSRTSFPRHLLYRAKAAPDRSLSRRL